MHYKYYLLNTMSQQTNFKLILCAFLLGLIMHPCNAQSNQTSVEIKDTTAIEDVFDFHIVDEKPEFPGGNECLFEYLSKAIRYPRLGGCGIQGRVICQFIIHEDGSINDINVIRSLDRDLDKEAVRIIKEMPKWEPGIHQGKPVKVRYTIPINFKLH